MQHSGSSHFHGHCRFADLRAASRILGFVLEAQNPAAHAQMELLIFLAARTALHPPSVASLDEAYPHPGCNRMGGHTSRRAGTRHGFKDI